MTTQSNYENELTKWRSDRISRLTAEDGWLNIIGRFWLDDKTYKVGSSSDNDIVLESGPAHIGSFTRNENGTVSFSPTTSDQKVILDPRDAHKRWHRADEILIEASILNDLLSLRFRQTDAVSREQFHGFDYFPVDPSWRIVADWKELSAPQRLEIDTVVDVQTHVAVTHTAKFTHDGENYELLATHGTAEAPMFLLRDATSGKETYGAARFLIGTDITETSIVLDFNKAFNPPCSLTNYAMCPLPPSQNILPFRIDAGEKKPH